MTKTLPTQELKHVSDGDKALPAGNSRRGYTGHTLDNSAGLTYMKARYYDHNIGRFLSNDPVGFSEHLSKLQGVQRFNRYSYANGNLYKFIDPDGRELYIVGGSAADQKKARIDLVAVGASGCTGVNAIFQLALSKNKHRLKVSPGRKLNKTYYGQTGVLLEDGNPNTGSGSDIIYDPDLEEGAADDSGNTKRPPAIALGHEIGHSADADQGIHPRKLLTDSKAPTPNNEKGLSMRIDNHLRSQDDTVGQRSNYNQ